MLQSLFPGRDIIHLFFFTIAECWSLSYKKSKLLLEKRRQYYSHISRGLYIDIMYSEIFVVAEAWKSVRYEIGTDSRRLCKTTLSSYDPRIISDYIN